MMIEKELNINNLRKIQTIKKKIKGSKSDGHPDRSQAIMFHGKPG